MTQWWTYTLGDFLMFSPRTYWRMVEQYNREAWPLHVLAVALGAAACIASARIGPARLLWCVLALAWSWVAWAFYWERRAQIDLAAPWLAGACVLQAAVLLVLAWRRVQPRIAPMGWALVAAGLVLYPFAGLAFGRPLSQAEVFGLMPDPTALVTLGVVLSRRTGAAIPLAAAVLLAGWLLQAAMLQ